MSGKYLTTQTKVKFDYLKLSIEDCPWRIGTQINLEDEQAHWNGELSILFLLPWHYNLDINNLSKLQP